MPVINSLTIANRGETMSEFDHVRVLSAYLSRLRLVDFERLHQASIETTHQQLNGNNRSQLDAQEKKFDVIRDAVKGMTDHDKEICARIVRESITA